MKSVLLAAKVYKLVFWSGYLLVILVSFIDLGFDLHRPTAKVLSIRFHYDQLLHALVYILITCYYFVGRYFHLFLFQSRQFLKFLVFVVILAVISEVIQIFIPFRTFSLSDIMSNFIGIVLGLLIFQFIIKNVFVLVSKRNN